MAKPSRSRRLKPLVDVGRQAPTGAWTPEALVAALTSGSDDDKVETLKDAGILDRRGKLTETYESWGSRVTRTPDADDPNA